MVEGDRLHAQIFENLRVVGPARHAEMDPRRPGALRQRQRQTDGTGAARGLHPRDAPTHRRVLAENIGHQRLDEAHIAFGPEVALGILLLEQPGFRALDGGKHRGRALAGAIDADPEVDLVLAIVVGVQFDQREQRIGGLGLELFEHGASMPPAVDPGNRKTSAFRQRFYRGGKAVLSRAPIRTEASAVPWRTSYSRR